MNEPAFPVPPGVDYLSLYAGMTLRDYFAASALQGMLAAQDASEMGYFETPDDASKEAYRQADSMLEVRMEK